MKRHLHKLALVGCFLVGGFAVADSGNKSVQKSKADQEKELREIQAGLDQAKAHFSKTHERLSTLREEPSDLPKGNAQFAIVFRNDLSSMFTPIGYEFTVDGRQIFAKNDPEGQLVAQKEREIFRSSLTPGEHALSVKVMLQGNGHGVFSYMKGYKVVAKASHTFVTVDEKLTQIKVVGYEKSGIKAEPKDRPAIDFLDTNWNVNVPSPSDSVTK